MEIGRYRITRRLGKGGMAEVYEAVAAGSDGFERRVAVKRLLEAHAGDPAFGRMFFDEARIASQLHHAHIAAVLDYGVDGGHPFLVLEYVDGVDAQALVELGRAAGRPLPVELALAIAIDIAHGLDHAHRATGPDGRPLGIVHRDVSPANLLVSWAGDVKLTDFGIAFARGKLEQTAAGLAKGTLLYMAPEQLMRGEIDGRTDVFSLGCVLHKLCTGESPLAGEHAMADLIAGASLTLAEDLPADVRAIVTQATRLLRSERHPDAGALAAALGQALARRIDTDPRSRMRAWLAEVRPGGDTTTPAPAPPGKLDALLGVGLVLSGVRATEKAGPERPTDGATELPARRPFHRLRAAAALAPVALGLVALLAWPRDAELAKAGAGPDAGAPGVRAPRFQAAGQTDAGGRSDEGLAGGAADAGGAPRGGPVAGVAPAPPDAGPVRASPAASPRPRPSSPALAAPVPAPPPRDAASDAAGVLAIGGEGAFRAEIHVDGRALGYAPRALDLPVGEHEVVLVRPDGQRLTRTVSVTPVHTRSSPLRWTVP